MRPPTCAGCLLPGEPWPPADSPALANRPRCVASQGLPTILSGWLAICEKSTSPITPPKSFCSGVSGCRPSGPACGACCATICPSSSTSCRRQAAGSRHTLGLPACLLKHSRVCSRPVQPDRSAQGMAHALWAGEWGRSRPKAGTDLRLELEQRVVGDVDHKGVGQAEEPDGHLARRGQPVQQRLCLGLGHRQHILPAAPRAEGAGHGRSTAQRSLAPASSPLLGRSTPGRTGKGAGCRRGLGWASSQRLRRAVSKLPT